MLDINLIETDIDSFIKNLFDKALEERASDIHLESYLKNGRIRFRIDGRLLEILKLEMDYYQKLVTKIKLMAKMDIAEKRRPQDSRISLDYYDNIDFRISSLTTVKGEKIVIRILSFKGFKDNSKLLGFSDNSKEIINKEIKEKSGMIIFSGPTGSGKTTSLYSLLNLLNDESVNIVSIEDPVEYILNGVNQVEVKEKIGLSFATLLRSILRQDPDIIMIGEIRDKETAKMAIRSAITGHLVLTTLHTNDSKTAIIRLKDLGIENYLLSSAINAVVSQRLVRKLCDCKKEDRMTEEEFEIFSKFLDVDREKKIFRPSSCPKCHGGYISREAIEEVLLIDEDIKNLIRSEDFSDDKIKNHLEKINFETMFVNGLKKVLEGVTSFEEVIPYNFEN